MKTHKHFLIIVISLLPLIGLVSCKNQDAEIEQLQQQVTSLQKQLKEEQDAKLSAQSKVTDLENQVKSLSQPVENLEDQEEEDLEIDLEDPQYEISDFVWKAMNFWYFWQEEVPLLADSQETDLTQYKNLIRDNMDPVSFFQKLTHSKDRFSWFIQDYEGQEKSFQGVSQDHGMQFRLGRYNSNDLFGFVQVVHRDSNAEQQGVKRGMYFTQINGISLNTGNYQSLIASTNFTINIAAPQFQGDDFNGFELTGQNIDLTQVENFARNPIVVSKVLEIGQHKVGYLFYNQFVRNLERHRELNDVFAQFNSAAITDLVVDLRYNRGGSSSTSNLLAAAISGRGESDIVSIEVWNSKVTNAFDLEPENFPGNIGDGITPINKLNLSRVYFITSESTASASEGLINNLKPYMDVFVVGEKTVGKNEGSLTLYDINDTEPRNYFYRNEDNASKLNTRHKYALQPLCVKSGNSAGFYEFEDGLPPDVQIEESVLQLGQLGDKNERLLAKTLELIVPASTEQRSYLPIKYQVEFELIERPEDQIGIWNFDHIIQRIQQ